MIELLRAIFDVLPKTATFIYKGTCVCCGVKVIIDIIPTSEGFGLLGGVFVERSTDTYAAKCIDCLKASPDILELHRAKSSIFPINTKTEMLSSMSPIDNLFKYGEEKDTHQSVACHDRPIGSAGRDRQ
jgi:hypothetical protein